ncbi:hypothetical protein B0H98_101350 [Vreelandella songnenensis]|uniref:Uncharacterized protein n=1 Tax=Vreelandella songnenensis TaxID=1176243 RepID=A0A2T0V849_9GAMM|nr:hypothetical protein B0H98_101350 [Halomonas songnenensis]
MVSAPGAPARAARRALPGLGDEVHNHALGGTSRAANRRPSAGALFARILAKRYHALRVCRRLLICYETVARGKPPGAPARAARRALPGLGDEVHNHALGGTSRAANRRPSAGALFARILAKRYHALRVCRRPLMWCRTVARGKPLGAPADAARRALPGLGDVVHKRACVPLARAANRRPFAGALFARILAKRYHALRVCRRLLMWCRTVARGKPLGAPADAARRALPGVG